MKLIAFSCWLMAIGTKGIPSGKAVNHNSIVKNL